MSYRLGILLTHPIQYYSPWFKHLDKKVDLEVFYAFKQSPKGQADAGFGVEFSWDIDLLDGYKFTWLNNISKKPELSSFFGCDTPEIYKIIRSKKFDAFIVFGWNYKSAIQAVIACKKNKIPVFMRGDSHLLSNRSRLKKILKYLPYRILLPRVNHLYVGKLNKEYLTHYGVPESKLFFVPHFVDNEYFKLKHQTALE
ncbi:MAG: glycosyltransferase family 1 protein, partial [Thermodesulfobacteriota bacterium]